MKLTADLEQQAIQELKQADSLQALKLVETKFLGKAGSIMALMKELGSLPADERPAFGKAVNEVRARVQEAYDSRFQILKSKEQEVQFQAEALDITLPSRKPSVGREHVLQLTINKIKEVFVGLGFEYVETPELESFKYNFEELNYPPDHPAFDEQDTFYVSDDLLLRTQMTAFQGRLLEQRKPPFRFFTVGRTFRNEAVDRTHGHTFHQVDAFMVDEGVSMANLKATLGLFARSMFGEDVTVRFRPDFFPFVEPGVDYAISTPKLFDGRWLELGGAGLVHPAILERYGVDTERYSGFAFGLGVERIPMMAYGVDDLRYFFENDLRFLEQFR
ncbi:MAG: phenylalanine--tRNA ligase subunit alpha [Armatimonadetes bacterium]|nr:phenylalanine--tRNA ligase subunit alpha [Armatimonadota bacterium]